MCKERITPSSRFGYRCLLVWILNNDSVHSLCRLSVWMVTFGTDINTWTNVKCTVSFDRGHGRSFVTIMGQKRFHFVHFRICLWVLTPCWLGFVNYHMCCLLLWFGNFLSPIFLAVSFQNY